MWVRQTAATFEGILLRVEVNRYEPCAGSVSGPWAMVLKCLAQRRGAHDLLSMSKTPDQAPATPALPAPDPTAQRPEVPKETGGPKGKDPTRYGDWESKGRCIDF